MTVITLSVAMTIGGVAASAAAIRSIDSDPSVIVEGTSPPDGPTLIDPDDDSDGAAPPTTRARPADDDVAATTPPVMTTAEAVTSSVAVDVSIPGDDTEPATANTTSAPTPTPTAPVSTIGSPATTSTSTTTPATATTTVAATTTTEPDDDDDDDGETDDEHTSTFECACGSVVVDPNTGGLDVRPETGYTYRLEDVERHDDGTRTQTVQFTGIGEDCELVVSLP